LAGGSNSETVLSIVDTINDAGFNSGYVAEQDSTNPNRVLITVIDINLSGSRGNGVISEPVESNTGAIQISQNMRGGIDAYQETFFSKHSKNISCTVPSAALNPLTGFLSTYDVGYITDRYESVPISIGYKSGVVVKVHGLQPFYSSSKIQVRFRYATNSDSQWSAWALMSPDGGGGGSFSFNLPSGTISKIQLNLFGSFSGYSLYETAV
jgi:hypothetical protein